MEIDYIKRFVVVGQTLSFRKSAEILFISQPTLSHSISKLEEQVGTALLQRNTKAVSLTSAGERFLVAAEELLGHYDVFEKEIDNIVRAAQPDKNLIRIGYMGPSLDNSFTPWLKEFHDENPGIDIQVTHYNNAGIKDALENGDIHLAVLFAEYVKDSSKIRTQLIMRERFQLCVNKKHPLASRETVTIDDIKDEPLIMSKRSAAPFYYDRIMKVFSQSGYAPKIQQEVDQMSDIYRMINIGMGVGILSFSGNSYYNQLDLRSIDIEGIRGKSHDKVIAWKEGNISSSENKLIKFFKSKAEE